MIPMILESESESPFALGSLDRRRKIRGCVHTDISDNKHVDGRNDSDLSSVAPPLSLASSRPRQAPPTGEIEAKDSSHRVAQVVVEKFLFTAICKLRSIIRGLY